MPMMVLAGLPFPLLPLALSVNGIDSHVLQTSTATVRRTAGGLARCIPYARGSSARPPGTEFVDGMPISLLRPKSLKFLLQQHSSSSSALRRGKNVCKDLAQPAGNQRVGEPTARIRQMKLIANRYGLLECWQQARDGHISSAPWAMQVHIWWCHASLAHTIDSREGGQKPCKGAQVL